MVDIRQAFPRIPTSDGNVALPGFLPLLGQAVDHHGQHVLNAPVQTLILIQTGLNIIR